MTSVLDAIASQGGWAVAIVGTVVVFLALYFLSLLFKFIPYVMELSLRYKLRKQGKLDITSEKNLSIDGDTNAAIAMAIYMMLDDNHDEESNIITIKRLSRRYSPWSSKIYNVMNLPGRSI
ncbi:MAG: OadG family protein [Salinivirgaceae bacterium]|nr:OadG family protein [Salinivirgaceae bacterium]MDD4745774.1 OadG family protein [Salinivirgaceae bacterium]MDY0279790.1 OadG family protein [Salinivirgaceae bacterium]